MVMLLFALKLKKMITCSADFVMDLDRDLNDVQYKPKNKKIMKEELISFETAKLAKEKGYKNGNSNIFTEYHSTYDYDGDPNHRESYKKGDVSPDSNFYMVNNEANIGDLSNEHYTLYERPTQSLLQKWLREIPKISIVIDDFITNEKIRYYHKVENLGWQDANSCEEPYETYEEAREDALKIALNKKR